MIKEFLIIVGTVIAIPLGLFLIFLAFRMAGMGWFKSMKEQLKGGNENDQKTR